MAMTQREFEARLRELVRKSRTFDRDALRASRDALRQAHTELLRQLAQLPDDASSYSRLQLTELARATERAMEEFDSRLSSNLEGAQANAQGESKEFVDRILRDAAGAQAPFIDLSRTQLLIAQDYSAALVKNLSREGQTRLDATLRRAFLGGQSQTEIIKQIGRSVNSGEFGVISRRAQTIYRTEVGRIQAAATQARLEQMVENGIPAKKMWVHAGTPVRVRFYHTAINRAVVEVPERFHGSGPNGQDLMYPRDPGGAAADTINCGCQMFPWIDEFKKFGGVTTPA